MGLQENFTLLQAAYTSSVVFASCRDPSSSPAAALFRELADMLQHNSISEVMYHGRITDTLSL